MCDDLPLDPQGSSFLSAPMPPPAILPSSTSNPFLQANAHDPIFTNPPQPTSPLHSPATTVNTMPFFPSDDDFFTLKPRALRQRRSSHIKRWIEEQQTKPKVTSKSPAHDLPRDTISQPPIATSSETYPAYPRLRRLSLRLESDESNSLQSYDLVDDQDIPAPEQNPPINLDASEHKSPPPSPTRVGRQSSNTLLHTPSLRNFHLSFRSNSPSISITESPTQSRSPSRISLFQRTSRASAPQHARASSSPTLYLSPPGISHSPPSSISGPRTRAPGWRWRPSVRGHVSSPSESGVYVANNGHRTSTSSTTITYTSTATTDITDEMSLVSSARSRAQTPFKHSGLSKNQSPSPSVWSLPRQPPSRNASPGSSSTPALVNNTPPLQHKSSTIRLPFTSKHKASESVPAGPHIAYAPSHRSKGSLPRVSFPSPSRNKKKKKLVISGIKAEDTRRFEAAKRWCESFGEVDHITRMPNGDLYVHFRKAEVADTVCRVRAKVNISGVGSVYLSWFTGNKP